MEHGAFGEAIGCFSKASYLMPREMSYAFHRAEAFLCLGDIQAAIDQYLRVCQFADNPRYISNRLAHAYFLSGQILMDQGRMDLALDQFDKSWKLFKENDQVLLCS